MMTISKISPALINIAPTMIVMMIVGAPVILIPLIFDQDGSASYGERVTNCSGCGERLHRGTLTPP